MTKKIFVNDRQILISTQIAEIPDANCLTFSITKYKELGSLLKVFLQDTHPTMQIIVPDLKEGFRSFKALFKVVDAAGGIVHHDGKFLCIVRNGIWDLPKGHIEKNEKPRKAAIREVVEETGIADPKILGKLGSTWHIYTSAGNLSLKRTRWYAMTAELGTLSPQTEEGIEAAVWLKREDLVERKPLFWLSLRDTIDKALIYFEKPSLENTASKS
ncbi:MAG: hypothetical protein RIS47_1274 [Bacteroidota bacterium]|jgi:8-oxo-dGTP pyrophosphatase MutT (NUDIX family)